MKTLVHGQETFDGVAVDITLTAAATKGDVRVFAGSIGVYVNTGEIGDVVAVRMIGVWSFNTTTADVVNIGDILYWNDTTKELTTTATGNTLAGVAWTSKQAATEGLVAVKIG